jgi:hypothetical protein
MLSVEGYIALPSGSVGCMSRSFPDTEKIEVCIYICVCVRYRLVLPCPALPRSLKLPAFCCWAFVVLYTRSAYGLDCLGVWDCGGVL